MYLPDPDARETALEETDRALYDQLEHHCRTDASELVMGEKDTALLRLLDKPQLICAKLAKPRPQITEDQLANYTGSRIGGRIEHRGPGGHATPAQHEDLAVWVAVDRDVYNVTGRWLLTTMMLDLADAIGNLRLGGIRCR